MPDRVFLDTNILIYGYSVDEKEKQAKAAEIINVLTEFNLHTQFEAVRLMGLYSLQFYDALIIATALEHGCHTLITEDMQHGLVVEGRLTINNPFVGL
jgi:predicted nucleic acid-binding protein